MLTLTLDAEKEGVLRQLLLSIGLQCVASLWGIHWNVQAVYKEELAEIKGTENQIM